MLAGSAGLGIAFAAVAASAAASAAAAERVASSGAFNGTKPLTVEFGATVKVKAELRLDTFFGKQVVSANATARNGGTVPMFCQYYVAFFDKDGKLLGCAAQGTLAEKGLAPNEEVSLGSCLVPLPPASRALVQSYQVAFYESEKEIGSP